jgi:hypothetical protein
MNHARAVSYDGSIVAIAESAEFDRSVTAGRQPSVLVSELRGHFFTGK